jgi:hypothetical protein
MPRRGRKSHNRGSRSRSRKSRSRKSRSRKSRSRKSRRSSDQKSRCLRRNDGTPPVMHYGSKGGCYFRSGGKKHYIQ